jgi:hypothetical protein
MSYERSDINVRGAVVFTVWLAVATAASLVLMLWLYRSFEARQLRADAAALPATRIPLAGPLHPPEPVLQGAPGSRFELQEPQRELEALRREEEQLLASSGWVDRNAGVVHSPIERANQLLLERGLPVRP